MRPRPGYRKCQPCIFQPPSCYVVILTTAWPALPTVPNLPAADLDHVLERTRDLWQVMRGERLFLTGGTGFFGRWLLETFVWANERLSLDAEIVLLSRDPGSFRRAEPWVDAHPGIAFHVGDVRRFDIPDGSFSFVIHAAAPSSSQSDPSDHLDMFTTVVRGTERVLEAAAAMRPEAFLFVSSGAVYGVQPNDLTHVPETYAGGPQLSAPESAYAEAKRAAEVLVAIHAQRYGLATKIARCFAFVGPHLPLDRHYAIGNFLRDAMHGGPIRLSGDGSPYRSYLYAADLAVWLWTILFKASPGSTYNVGSEEGMPLVKVARHVAQVVGGGCDVVLDRTPDPARRPQRYVPSTERARRDLGLDQWISIDDAIGRTAAWHARRSAERVGP